MKNGHTTRQKAPAGRYALLDELRGLDLVSMMLYHGCWDLVNLFGIQADWYYSLPGHLWQQTICCPVSVCNWGIIPCAGAHRCSGQARLSRRSRCFLCRRTGSFLVY